jgi:hypothetical protein
LAALAAAAVFISGAGAVLVGSPSSFESADPVVPATNPPTFDANMTVETAGNSDWNCFAGHPGFHSPASDITVGQNCFGFTSADFANAFTTSDPAATTSDDSWVSGTKMDLACEPVGTNKNPGKDDFVNIASYSEQRASNKHTYLYGATIRYTANGSASENVELNQNPGTASCPILRTNGDHLLAFDYNSGGKVLDLHALVWIDSSDPTGGGTQTTPGACVIKNDTMPCWGATVLSPSPTSFEGDTNASAIPKAKNAISYADLVSGQFAEFGVDLTTALNQNPNACNTTNQIDWESRSSGSSFSSNPEDLTIEHHTISNCGSITIVKNTDPRNINQNFSYTASGGTISPTSFKLNDRNALSISSISAANPAVVTTASNGFTAGDKVGVTITGSNSTPSANGDWTATVIDGTHFSIPLAVTTAGGSAGTVTFNKQVYNNLLGGNTYTVTEGTEPPGFSLENLSCTNNGTTDNSVVDKPNAKVTINLTPNDNWVCTYQNQALAEIKIIKHTDVRGIDQKFTYSSGSGGANGLGTDSTAGGVACTAGGSSGVSNGSFCLNDAGNTSGDNTANTLDVKNLPVGSYNVTETMPNGWTLEGLTCSADAGSGSTGGQHVGTPLQADITLTAGGTVTCTYQNKAPSGAILVTKTGKYKGCTTGGTAIIVGASQIGVCTGNGTAALGGASFDVSTDMLDAMPVFGSPITTSNATGTACIDGLFWNGTGNHYFVTEKVAPGGYSIDSAAAVDVVVSANATCNATHTGLATGTSGVVSGTTSAPSFTDTPLASLEVIATSETHNATESTITCTHKVSGVDTTVGTPITTPVDPAHWGPTLHLKPDTYSCIVVIDP